MYVCTYETMRKRATKSNADVVVGRRKRSKRSNSTATVFVRIQIENVDIFVVSVSHRYVVAAAAAKVVGCRLLLLLHFLLRLVLSVHVMWTYLSVMGKRHSLPDSNSYLFTYANVIIIHLFIR